MKKLFQIKSYIRIPKVAITDLEEINNNPDKYFVDINNELDMSKIITQLDFDYFEGAIYFSYNQQIILDFRHWDLIDQLWAYFINLIDNYYNSNGNAETFFPDQPVKIEFKRISDKLILLSIQEQKVFNIVLPEKDLFLAILDNGEQFFEKTAEYNPQEKARYKFAIEGIKELRKRVHRANS